MASRRKTGDYSPVSNSDPDENVDVPQQVNRPHILMNESRTWKDVLTRGNIAKCSCGVCFVILCLCLVVAAVNLVREIFPETDLVLNSQCTAPMQNWDGKILNFQVWENTYSSRPSYYNLHNENEYVGNDSNHHIELKNNAGNKRPVIIFGTHHKTGTFLAKKLFSRICSKMNWCCLFHVTRDSIHMLADALQNEPVNALGHNQWIWNPNDLDIANYRFVHFYRHPYKKVISGYRYHADGTEEWTQKPLTYQHLCASPFYTQGSVSPKESASVMWEYCEAVHLCETCCRMEHEREVVHNSVRKVEVVQRRKLEYQFLCDKLGHGADIMKKAFDAHRQHPERIKNFHHTSTPSIQEMLLNQPAHEGILTEAALDFYENLRMAQIINDTAGDPRTLNIDLDDLNSNYAEVTLRLLEFLRGVIPGRRIMELHKDLAFYDLETSPVYRWSMSNPLVNHVTAKGSGGSTPAPSAPGVSGGSLSGGHLKGSANASAAVSALAQSQDTEQTASSSFLMSVLRNDPQVTELYAPVLELMKSVLSPTGTKPVAKHP